MLNGELTLGFRKGLALLLSIKKNKIRIATERLEMNLSLVGDLVGTAEMLLFVK